MTVSVWWLIPAFYIGLFGGISVTCCCMKLKKSAHYGHF